jgi:endonuclease-8
VPEGDTVWNTARALHRALAGQRLTASDIRVPRLATVDLAGWTVLESASRGKHLLLRLRGPAEPNDPDAPHGTAEPNDPDAPHGPDERRDSAGLRDTGRRRDTAGGGDGWHRTLHSHLRMDGAWRVYAPGERWAARPAHLIRVVLRTAGAIAVGYQLHELALLPTAREETLTGHLGPDLLGSDWDPAEAVRRLARHPETTIAEALLDQANLAGVGNLYKSELLFLRGLWPWAPVRDVPDLAGAVALAQRLLAANRGRWTQSTTGSVRRGQTTYV